MRVWVWVFAGLGALAAACGGSGGGNGDGTFVADAGHDAQVSSSSSSSSGTSSGERADGAASSSSGDGGSSGAPDGAVTSSSSGGGSSSGSSGLAPQCDPGATAGTDLGIVLDFGATAPVAVTVSADGLSAAWVTGESGNVDVHYADRDDLEDPFGAPRTMHGAWAADRVALGLHGLVLAAVRADRLGFDAFQRAQHEVDFAAPAVNPLDNMNSEDLADQGQFYGDPSYARDDSYFVYSRYGGGLTQTILLGSKLLVDQHFSNGTPISDASFLASTAAGRRRPVALADDARTLFYFDEADSTAYVTSRDDQGGPFVAPKALGAWLDARPVAQCGSLVYRPAAKPTELHAVSYE